MLHGKHQFYSHLKSSCQAWFGIFHNLEFGLQSKMANTCACIRSEAEKWLSEYRAVIEWVVSSGKDRLVGEAIDSVKDA